MFEFEKVVQFGTLPSSQQALFILREQLGNATLKRFGWMEIRHRLWRSSACDEVNDFHIKPGSPRS
jgi:hypothetical protein